ncbi:uncharacterized protein LOC109919963 [Rhincodon typus]|uniref:uncharacterized protein LOC109919963 n=1 Tax=Rhincodon typus TaxID=259920 RepID=UPI00202DF628|nr:uncharacterized protein LOC109919963 [Rhincodon typus]
MTQGAIRKEQDAVCSVIPFWPSAAVGTETRLTLPSATWKKDDSGESKPRGKRSRSDRYPVTRDRIEFSLWERLARPRSSSSPDLPRATPDSDRNWPAGRRVPLGRLPLPLEEATPGRLRRGAPRPRSGVYIGDQAARWNRVKADLALPSDEEVARVLLDVFIEKRMHQPGPSHTVQETDLDVEADVSHDSAKEDNEQVDLDSVPSLSAGSESTVTLSHPSSIGSMEDETDNSLFSGAGSTSDSVSKYPLEESSPRAKAEPAEREPYSEGLGYGHHHGSKDRHPETKSTETDRVVPSET